MTNRLDIPVQFRKWKREDNSLNVQDWACPEQFLNYLHYRNYPIISIIGRNESAIGQPLSVNRDPDVT